MSKTLYLRTYEGRESRRLTFHKDAVREPESVLVWHTRLVSYMLPVSKAYLEEIQKSFWKRKLFFLWLVFCFAGRKQKGIVKEIRRAMREGRIRALCEPNEKLFRYYAKDYLINCYHWTGKETFGILCSPYFDGDTVTELIRSCNPNAKEIILFRSEVYDPDLADYQAENGMMITKTGDYFQLENCQIILDGGMESYQQLKYLPRGCTYIDLSTDEMKRRRITRKSAEILYISLGNFLDRHFRVEI